MYGGAKNLHEMLETLCMTLNISKNCNCEDNLILWLQTYYSLCCDGDWEHGYGNSIQKMENYSWKVTLVLKDTLFEDFTFDPIMTKISSDNWFSCSLEKNEHDNISLIGYASSQNLTAIIRNFKNWMEQTIGTVPFIEL